MLTVRLPDDLEAEVDRIASTVEALAVFLFVPGLFHLR